MLQTKLFTKSSKESPKDEPSKNAQLLEQGAFVQKLLAGVYNYLPLGNRVLQKIEKIVREEMDKVGAEILMPSLQPKENWEKTNRWNDLDVLFKVKSQHGYEYALGPTHEENIAPLAKKLISSYRDLPVAFYQIQTKFRDEARAKSGLLRGREFRMKDLYSFHTNQADLDLYYSKVQETYQRVFNRLGVKAILTEASGGSFSKYSHEYQVETDAGEDVIYICEHCEKEGQPIAKNKEIYSGEDEKCSQCGKSQWRETKACEVGNIFKLGTKYSAPFEVTYVDESDGVETAIMGCYGIGTTRLMGVIAEVHNDDKGLKWPKEVSPFLIHITPLTNKDPQTQEKVWQEAQQIYDLLTSKGYEVLLDDRQESAGVKFNDSDLIGIPHRLVVSEKTLKEDSVEWKERAGDQAKLVKIKEIISVLNI
ncbi:MAG: proline--tRNA ligase [Candidatus Doudnabacteria bacterium]